MVTSIMVVVENLELISRSCDSITLYDNQCLYGEMIDYSRKNKEYIRSIPDKEVGPIIKNLVIVWFDMIEGYAELAKMGNDKYCIPAKIKCIASHAKLFLLEYGNYEITVLALKKRVVRND